MKMIAVSYTNRTPWRHELILDVAIRKHELSRIDVANFSGRYLASGGVLVGCLHGDVVPSSPTPPRSNEE